MEHYFLIESRDPFECAEVLKDYELASDLAGAGNQATLFLAQNGVLPLRGGAHLAHLTRLMDRGVKLVCDEYSLAERGMQDVSLPGGAIVAGVETVVAQLAGRSRVIWL